MAISAALFEKMPPEIRALVQPAANPGKDAVVALFPQSAGQLADASSSSSRKTQNVYGAMKRGNGRDGEASADRRYSDTGGTNFAATPGQPRGDSGSAARFFNTFPADEFPWPLAFYHSKAGKADRRAELVDKAAGEKPHPTVKPIGLLRHLVRHICPQGGTVLDPFGGTGTTGEAARLEGMNAVLMEAEPEYIAFLRRRFDLTNVSEDDLGDLFGSVNHRISLDRNTSSEIDQYDDLSDLL